MTKELIDIVWGCLPREFRKEVKRQYQGAIDCNELYTQYIFECLFGEDNLISNGREAELPHMIRQNAEGKSNRSSVERSFNLLIKDLHGVAESIYKVSESLIRLRNAEEEEKHNLEEIGYC